MECSGFFCRECISDHLGRLLCTQCLLKLASPPRERRRLNLGWLGRGAQLLLGLVLAWLVFYYAGRSLIAIPTEVHDATLFLDFQEAFTADDE